MIYAREHLGANAVEVDVEMRIHAEGGIDGIPKETLELVVLEGLRQLGLQPEIENPPTGAGQ